MIQNFLFFPVICIILWRIKYERTFHKVSRTVTDSVSNSQYQFLIFCLISSVCCLLKTTFATYISYDIGKLSLQQPPAACKCPIVHILCPTELIVLGNKFLKTRFDFKANL